LALLAETTGGPSLALVVSATAILACLGTLNGWLLLAGRIPVAAAEDGLFPAALGRIHPRFRTPAFGLVLAAAIATGMLFLLLFEEFLDAFDFVVYLALVLTLVPHLLAAAADWRFASGAGRVAPTLAIAFVVFAIVGCGAEAIGWSALLVVFGIVLHVARARRASRG
jgi:APA family basic amino acid/polyamine antiporter